MVCTKLLLDAGSNIDHADDGGETALDVAINQNSCPVMQMLVKAGARYDAGKAAEGFGRRAMFACEARTIKYIISYNLIISNKYFVNNPFGQFVV